MTGTHRAEPASPGALRVLVRAHLRRDRWLLLWWCVGGALLYWTQAVSVDQIYTTQADFDRAAASMEGNAAMVAMTGPTRALNTVGGQVTWQSTAFGAVVVGLMCMLLVGRHTRGEEEAGRDELVRAAVVSRRAPLLAALLVALLGASGMGLLVSVSLVAYRLAVADSLALGVGLALVGAVAAACALVAAQLTSSLRSMYGLVGATLGAWYALRAVGDVTGGHLSWLSPIGWYQGMHAFSGVRWWPASLLLVAAVLATAGAFALFERRDIGAGLWAARPGPADAGAWLGGTVGLTWRLQRGAVLGWAAGLLLTGLAYGSIGDSVGELLGDSQASRQLIAGSSDDLVAGFYATAAVMLALITCGFAISSALRPGGEEDEGRAELLLAAPLARRRWLGAHLLVTALGTAVVLLAGAVGLAAGYVLVTDDAARALRFAAAVPPYLAPVLVLAGAAAVLHGAHRRLAPAAWLLLLGCVVVLLFGETWRIPDPVRGLSPFWHLALWPAEPFAWEAVLGVVGVAAALAVLAQVLLARRDVG